ncbi:MAG: hypothetical protein JST15_13760 [Bacteroidetes bacterium]|nr:hypothetical protein [Bacteroidota bacterium]
MKKVLISFASINDSNREKDGAILTVFKKRRFDEVHLIWNPSEFRNFFEIAKYIKSEIEKRKYCRKVTIHTFECDDVTDHNEIYPKLLNLCRTLDTKSRSFTAAIASGTPSMQACWILMAESGDFPLKLIRSDDAKYGKPIVREVKLSAALPRILRLQEENEELKRERKGLLPKVILNITKAFIIIGKEELYLSPVEFSYYRYFLERAKSEKQYLRIDIDEVPEEFYRSVMKFHKDSFPQADSNRFFTEKNKSIASATFRANTAKLNKKIRSLLGAATVSNYFIIESVGKRFRKSYGINLPQENIRITD